MGLHIGKLRFHNFRNYADFELGDLGDLTILVGPNAVGKTNIIEGIQLLTSLDSFRNASVEQLVHLGQSSAFLKAWLVGDERELEVGLRLDDRGRRYSLNGKQRPRNELVGQLPAVLFTPDHLQLVKGGPELRRASLDRLGCQVSHNYLGVKRDYEKLLRQKNQLLKDEMPSSYLESVNEVLVKIGSQLFLYRMKVLEGIRALLSERHRLITGTDELASLEYIPSWVSEEKGKTSSSTYWDSKDVNTEQTGDIRTEVERLLARALELRGDEERRRHTSLVGPHRDKPFFLINGQAAHDFASQGQQRSLSIAYKLSELRLIEQMSGSKPLLLLDDVMSELDVTRRTTMMSYLQDAAQTFITTTNKEYFSQDILDQAKLVKLPRS